MQAGQCVANVGHDKTLQLGLQPPLHDLLLVEAKLQQGLHRSIGYWAGKCQSCQELQRGRAGHSASGRAEFRLKQRLAHYRHHANLQQQTIALELAHDDLDVGLSCGTREGDDGQHVCDLG
ncbi:hypothetical protein HaLaN_17723, partial [Haematococcus lacustris]